MAQFKHHWRTLDPKIDRLKQDGLNASAIARELKIDRRTLTDHRHDLRRDAGTSQVPATVKRQVPRRYSQGTQPPDLDTLTATLMPHLLDALKPAVESWLAEQVPPQVPGQVPSQVPSKVLDKVPGPNAVEYLQGTSGYPPDPQRKDQFHWHLPAGELWELRAVAEGLQVDKSLLLRKLWRAFMRTPEAQAGLERYRTGRSTRAGTRPGTS
jgi:hypothetical protein